MSQLSIEEIKEEIMTVHNKVKELTGIEMNLFRPPYGDYDDDVITTCITQYNGIVTAWTGRTTARTI